MSRGSVLHSFNCNPAICEQPWLTTGLQRPFSNTVARMPLAKQRCAGTVDQAEEIQMHIG